MENLDIAENRAAQKYPLGIQLRRVSWGIGKRVFRLIPRPFYAPRRFLLRLFGAKIGRKVNVANTAQVYFPWNVEIGDWSAIGERTMIYSLGKVWIGEKTTLSQGAHLCAGTHDYRQASMPLQTPPIRVGNQVWVCADSFVGPNVTIGDGAVIGARSVVCRDVESWMVVAGNPARPIKKREIDEPASS